MLVLLPYSLGPDKRPFPLCRAAAHAAKPRSQALPQLFGCRTYRLSQNIKPLIWVECQVEKHSRSRTEYLVKARSQFKERSTATSVEILLPLPPDAISPTVRTSQASKPVAAPSCHWPPAGGHQRNYPGPSPAVGGARGRAMHDLHSLQRVKHARGCVASICCLLLQGTAVYAPEKDALVWKIKNFPGGREFLLCCKFGLPSVAAEEEAHGRLPPIKVKFEVRRRGVCGRWLHQC